VAGQPAFMREDLEHVGATLERLYRLVSRVLSKSLDSLVEGRPVDIDDEVAIAEELKGLVEYTATLFIARYQPLGDPLIEALSAIRVSYDLYRIARYARELTYTAARLPGVRPPGDVAEAAEAAKRGLEEAYKAYKTGDEGARRRVLEADERVDSLYIARLDMLREKQSLTAEEAAALLALRHLERILDHEVYITNAKSRPA